MSNDLTNQALKIAQRLFQKEGERTCAYHHASDLLHHRAGIRSTTRCTRGYQPNQVERLVEAALNWNRLEEGVT